MEDFNEGVDGKLASRLRRANSEQFFTLVKMHLSFELDINTEDNDPVTEKAKIKKWSLPNFSKKPKSQMTPQQQRGGEGASLSPEGINQVKQLIEYLSQEQCLSQEGIFRRTGKLTRQQELKSSLYQGDSLTLDDGTYSVHDCASVLKCFLAELPEPLLTDLHYPAHCQIAELCTPDPNPNESRLLTSIQLLLLLLPLVNRILLKYLLILLNKTAALESSNKMNCDTLATLFTPHLICPRKLSPEALHINSQNLSGLVAFMIRKCRDLFDIPPKLATDIRAYWVNQERRLLSPKKSDLNESTPDTTGTAHTVFSFVDHQLTAQANSTDDTQAALAQLYAHIQAMPESAKKRRLVKQFNKENGQGTPRHVKQDRTKSIGESIKKHIFQKKILGTKKFSDSGCNIIPRASSEEQFYSESHKKTAISPKKLFHKSEDELKNLIRTPTESLIIPKYIRNSTGSLNSTCTSQRKPNIMVVNVIEVDDEEEIDEDYDSPYKYSETLATSEKFSLGSLKKLGNSSEKERPKSDGYSDSTDSGVGRFNSEPLHLYSSEIDLDEIDNSSEQTFDPVPTVSQRHSIEVVCASSEPNLHTKLNCLSQLHHISKGSHSPVRTNKKWNIYNTHTSTPSELLRRSMANNDYGLTPITNHDKSMSPITQSTSKMPKAMQETMMTPRCRKPVVAISGSNICNLPSLNQNQGQSGPPHRLQLVNIDINEDSYEHSLPVIEEDPKLKKIGSETLIYEDENKENFEQSKDRNCISSIDNNYLTTQQNSTSITSTFREYLLSRSVLTASPVDLSFTSRTGDFEQSESDINVLNDEALSDSLLHCLDGNNPGSDTSGIASSSTNSTNDSNEKIDDNGPTTRKRCTSLQRNDSKRSNKSGKKCDELNEDILENHLSDSTLNFDRMNDTSFQETSF